MAWGDTTEEQGWFTLHSHILLWIVNFDHLVTMLWSNKEDIREKAKTELLKYFEKLYVLLMTSERRNLCIRNLARNPVNVLDNQEMFLLKTVVVLICVETKH